MLPLVLHWFFIEWYSGKKRLALSVNLPGWTDVGIIIFYKTLSSNFTSIVLKVTNLFFLYLLITFDCGKKT